MTLPTLQVQLDDGTGTFPFDITSKVKFIEGYDISRGRDDWQGAVTAGELTNITLNNSDGRFTPGSTILATPSPITVDQRIRVKETVNGVTYTRFTGYVKSWPVSWPAVVTTFSTVQVAATDAQARMERWTLRSMLEEEILLRTPTAYYMLAEPTGATSAGDTSGNQAVSLSEVGTGAAVSFGTGTGPGTDGLTAAQFFGGQYLRGGSGSVVAIPATYSLGAWFATTTTPGINAYIAASKGWSLRVNSSGQLVVFCAPLGIVITGSASVVDGLTHFAAVTSDGATATVYLDGAVAGTGAVSGSGTDLDYLSVGAEATAGVLPFTGTVSHVATFTSALSAFQVGQIYTTGVGAAETVDLRVQRFVGYTGQNITTVGLSGGSVTGQSTSGKSAWEAMQEVATAEGGVVFGNATGSFTFEGRNFQAAKTVPDLTLTSQWVTPDVQPVVDDQGLINYSEVTAEGTGIPQLAHNIASETTHGRYPDSRSYLVQTDAEALDRGNWIVNNFAEPSPRYGTLTINLYGMTASMASTVVAALDLNCWLRVTSLASQNPGGTTADVVVQGWHAHTDAESWTITCNVVARSLYEAWVLGDATRSVLGSTTRLYY